jgi:membrane protease YdiL (CAAX protease family)
LKIKQILGWILIALGVTLLVATIMSSPSSLGLGNIFGPVPHLVAALLVLGGLAMVRGDRKKGPSKSSIAASWIGIILGGFVLLICGIAFLLLLFIIFMSMAAEGFDTTNALLELPGLVVIVILAFFAFMIVRKSYNMLKGFSADKVSGEPKDKNGA